MKKLLLMIAASALAVSAVQGQNLLVNPDWSAGLDSAWEGFEGGIFVGRAPSSFTTLSGVVATVTPDTTNELNFYQTMGVGGPALTAGTTYQFDIDAANIGTDVTPEYFVKAFDGAWGFIGAEFQNVALVAGTNSLTFTAQAGTVYYQVGVYTIGATSGSYDVTNPSLTVVPEPSTFALLGGLLALGFVVYRRRK